MQELHLWPGCETVEGLGCLGIWAESLKTKVMRTSVDLSDTQLQALNELSRKEERSRAALICQAIDVYLAKQRDEQKGVALGLWGKRKVDGLAYQEKVRSEW